MGPARHSVEAAGVPAAGRWERLRRAGGAPDVSTLHRDLLMPLADAEGVVARVRAELQL